MSIHSTARALADLCAAKNAAYGDSVTRSTDALRLIYPNGIAPEQYLDAILAARDFDKRSRLAQRAPDAHGEDPRLDIAGYALLALHIAKDKKAWPANESASVPDAESLSNGRATASAATDANAKTTTSESGTSAPLSSQPRSESFASTSERASTSTISVPALAATGGARRGVVAPPRSERWFWRLSARERWVVRVLLPAGWVAALAAMIFARVLFPAFVVVFVWLIVGYTYEITVGTIRSANSPYWGEEENL